MLVDCSSQASQSTSDRAVLAVAACVEESSQTPEHVMVHASTLTLQPQLCHVGLETCPPSCQDAGAQTAQSDELIMPTRPCLFEVSIQVDRGHFGVEASTQVDNVEACDLGTPSHTDACLGASAAVAELQPQIRIDASTQADANIACSNQHGCIEASAQTEALDDLAGDAKLWLETRPTSVDQSTQVDSTPLPSDNCLQKVERSTQVEFSCEAASHLPEEVNTRVGQADTQARAPAAIDAGCGGPRQDSSANLLPDHSAACTEFRASGAAEDREARGAAENIELASEALSARVQCSEEVVEGHHKEEKVTAETEPLLTAGVVHEVSGPVCSRRVGTQTAVQGFVPLGEPKLKLMKMKAPQATQGMWQCLALGLVSGFLIGMVVSLALVPNRGDGLLIV